MEATDHRHLSEPSPDEVAKVFVKIYYEILFVSPDQLHKFYRDSSVVSRPSGSDGSMTTATTMEAINDIISSSFFHVNDYRLEILDVAAQKSLMGGVFLSVICSLIPKNNMELRKKQFIQTFFLAFQDKAYVVLNDLLRFVDSQNPTVPKHKPPLIFTDSNPVGNDSNETVSIPVPVSPQESKPDTSLEDQQTPKSTDPNIVCNGGENSPVVVERITEFTPKEANTVVSDHVVEVSTDAQPTKFSYASTLAKKVTGLQTSKCEVTWFGAKDGLDPETVTRPQTVASRWLNQTQNPSNSKAVVTENKHHPADGRPRGVFIGNLPPRTTKTDLVKVMKQFGGIRWERLLIREREDGSCYGLLDFESPESARHAVETHRVDFNGYEAYILYKKSVIKKSSNNGTGGLEERMSNGGVLHESESNGGVLHESESNDGFERPRRRNRKGRGKA